MTAPSLSRHVFKTSRLAEFSSKKELVNQTGHAVEDWPLVVLKELVDNALDSTEEAGIAPAIQISVSQDCITVADNGPGIAPETVADIIDYTARVSSREAYVSPTRGAQGNALKTILAMPFSLDGERGDTVIESQGVAHRIAFSIDPIRQEPRIVGVCEASLVKTGTRISILWPDSASSILDDTQADFLQIAEDYTWINAHLTLTVVWDRAGCELVQWAIPATDSAWRKWRPSDPISPHWYDEARLARLIACNIAYAQDRGALCRTVAICGDPFRHLDVLGQSLGSILTKQRAGPSEPIITVLHLACPRIEYLDRGKSSANLPGAPAKVIADLIEDVTEKWAKQRRAEERDRSARARRADRLIRRERPRSLKDAAASVMEQAYMAASANGTLPANPRQVMYCARPKILAITGRGSLDSQYFSQTLLVDYVKEHPEECVGWDVIWDDRGYFVEPHTGRRIGLGTIAIRRYIARYASPILCEAGYAGASVATYGPVGRYGALLYIEKEGFLPILELNAMASDQFIAFVDSKLTEAGIAKVVPPNARLDEGSRLFARSKRVEAVVEEAIAALAGAEFGVPDDLGDQVRAYLAEHPDEPWEHAVRHAAADFDAESEK